MKTDNYKITQYTVNNILGYVESSQIAIPEIQRPFVWKDKEVKELIDSLYRGYPIGYLIVWQNSQVRVRGFGRGGTKKILIDGQQRVTALMAALLGRKVLDEQYQSRRIKIAFNPLAGEEEDSFAVYSEAMEKDSKWIPDISILFRRDFSFRKFEKEYLRSNPGEAISGLEEAVDRLRGIIKHQVGIIELSFMLDIDVVSEIFIRINLQGKPLNQEDFVMSKISVNEEYEGDSIRNCIDYFCHLLKEPSFYSILKENEKDFMGTAYGQALSWTRTEQSYLYIPSYGDVLKVVLLAWFGKSKIGDLVNLLSGKQTGKGVVSRELMKESFRLLSEGVLAFVREEHFKGFLSALSEAGYCCSRLMYSQPVLNYCYAMYLVMVQQGIPAEKRKQLLGKWMTFCLITGHYQSQAEKTALKDREIALEEGFEAYLTQLEELVLTPDFYEAILPDKFTATTARTAPYLAYIAALCKNNAPSLYHQEVTVRELYMAHTESTQLLPKAYLAQCGFKTREIYGQTANLVYLSKEVKGILKRKSPGDYEEMLRQNMGDEEIEATLEANAIPSSLFRTDKTNIEAFLRDRRKMMAHTIEKYYQSI